ncbi:MAG: esterase-like activity of phytase family protein [Acidobacteria bacterium]|nr:esterase-like activity of phytase family protein [Acidobacteriota bacterium]
MRRFVIAVLCALVAGATLSASVPAWRDLMSWKPRPQLRRVLAHERSFQRVGTFANYRNNANIGDQTVAEIVAATADGRTLVYTDSPMGEIGLIDITNPARPQPLGKVAFAGGHEPTSVAVLGNQYALVAVNSSTSFTNTSGYLAVVDLGTRVVVRQIDLGGQPDSLKISHDHRYAAIAIENERDELLCAGGAATGVAIVEDDDDYVPGTNTTEDLCAGGGGVPGGLPQTPFGNPAGYLVVVDLTGPNPFGWTRSDVALTGLAGYAPEDPEPEFVDINARNEAVVTLQENNHIAIVDLRTKGVIADFPAGAVNLSGIDATEDDVIDLSDSLANVAREPDAVVWVPGPSGRHRIATANEGDLFGGSRGFSIFERHGAVVFDSGAEFEEIAVQHGHYPESRSENKGSEPESITYGRFAGEDYLFVASERGSFVAAYTLDRTGQPQFSQLLPAPLGPEGLLAIPHRNLLIASGEEDDPSYGVRSTVMIYQLQRGPAEYPQILSDDSSGSPIPWSALSGMTSVPGQPDTLLGVWDSYYGESRIFRIDVSERPALITDAITIQGGGGNYDPEGIAIAPDETIWIASEGNASDSRRNLLIQTDADGNVLQEVGLPAEIIACRAATAKRGTLGSGFEGVAAIRTGATYRLLVAQQRGWDYTTAACEDLDDDAGGLNASGEPNWSRIWVYDPQTSAWDHVSWELAPKAATSTWVGLSEITDTPWGDLILIERDNRTGDFGALKTLVKIRYDAAEDRLVTGSEKSVFDLLPRMKSTNGWITDKPEGVAVTGDGRAFVVTDNDGVDDWSGETSFFRLGHYWRLFR